MNSTSVLIRYFKIYEFNVILKEIFQNMNRTMKIIYTKPWDQRMAGLKNKNRESWSWIRLL